MSYFMAFLRFIPRAVWKNKPFNPRVMAGSELFGYYGLERSTRVYGLAGEAMLNFSYYGILPAFAILGAFLGWFRKKLATLNPSDARFFLVPFMIWACMFSVNLDMDNIVFNSLKLGTLPFIAIRSSSLRLKI
jgi:hypothetical protein